MHLTLKICMPLAAAIIFAVELVHAQLLPAKFQELLTQNNMHFTLPADFTPVAVNKSSDIPYDFAIKSNSEKLEIRYRIWPVDRTDRNANALYEPMLVAMAATISNGKLIRPQQYPAQSVKKEFGADAGCTSMVPVNSEFGKRYTSCMISVIHKSNVADCYVFYLFDDQKTIMNALAAKEIFYALTFK